MEQKDNEERDRRGEKKGPLTSRDADAGRSNAFIISFHLWTRSSFVLSNANMYTRVRVCAAASNSHFGRKNGKQASKQRARIPHAFKNKR